MRGKLASPPGWVSIACIGEGWVWLEKCDDDPPRTSAAVEEEPLNHVTVEFATAEHCEGAKGNMILVAQWLTGVALA